MYIEKLTDEEIKKISKQYLSLIMSEQKASESIAGGTMRRYKTCARYDFIDDEYEYQSFTNSLPCSISKFSERI